MRNLGEIDPDHPDNPANEARACCALCAVKEYLVLATFFLIIVDTFDVYANTIRVTGTDLLPFWGNTTELYYTAIPELNYYDMGVSLLELFTVICLGLSVCGNSINGIMCSLCGFATAMVLEFVYVLWLVVAVTVDAIQEQLTTFTTVMLICYTIVPYGGLVLIRAYTLMKAQAFQRSLKRNREWRIKNENSLLLARP